MSSALSDNVAGHKKKYELLKASLPPEEVGKVFVGGTDPLWMGYYELEMIRRHRPLRGASVVDIGCGIGRLTQHMLHEPIAHYLGIDIVPEILDEARALTAHDSRFSFAIGEQCRIPLEDGTADVVVAFSVITHLLNEEVFEYFLEARRVLRPGGVAIFSFLDFMYPQHVENFFKHVTYHRQGHGDLLTFTTKEVLSLFARRAGFTAHSFIDGVEAHSTSGATSPLISAEMVPPTFQLGQSSCILRV